MSVSQTCCTHTHKWADSRATQYPEQTCHPLSQKLWLRSINSKHRTVQYINETVQTSHGQGRYFTHTQTPTVSQLDSVGIVCNHYHPQNAVHCQHTENFPWVKLQCVLAGHWCCPKLHIQYVCTIINIIPNIKTLNAYEFSSKVQKLYNVCIYKSSLDTSDLKLN